MNDTHDEETEEEHAVRLRKISEEVKADINAGRYKNGQIHPHIHGSYKFEGTVTGRLERKIEWKDPPTLDKEPFFDLDRYYRHLVPSRSETKALIGHMARLIYVDECHHIDPSTYWVSEYKPEPKEKDWDCKTFKSGGSTAPSDEVRAKLRAKRRAKRK